LNWTETCALFGLADFHVLSEIYVALICHSDRLIWQVTVHQNMNGRVSAVLTARLKLLVPNG